MITLNKIQSKLANAIINSKYTQTELGKLVGVNHSQISCYIHGKKMPAIDTFAKLIAVLDLDPIDILCIKDYNL